MNNVVTTLLYEEMTNTKVVDLDELYIFGILHFLAKIIWCFKIYSLTHIHKYIVSYACINEVLQTHTLTQILHVQQLASLL